MRHLTIVPCSEPWDRMTTIADGSGARRCDTCERDVVDTTTLDDEELHALASAAQTGQICARLVLEGGRPRTRVGVAAGLAVALAGCATASGPEPASDQLSFAEVIADGDIDDDRGSIVGVVSDLSGRPIANALVVLQGTSLRSPLEHMTNKRGIYVFRDLPPGNYTIQVLAGKADVSKITALAEGARVRANFALNPKAAEMVGMLVERPMIDTTSASSTY